MPFLLIPIILIAVGIVLLLVIGLSLAIGVALIHLLFGPVLLALIIWWAYRHFHHGSPRHEDWQRYAPHERKQAHHVHEEPVHHDSHDDWSDF